ncbi:MAG: glycosyltransferase [Chloroflexia bacterium]
MNPIVVFSHLRWDFVYQRPQHLLTRMAQNRRVIFIEEPLYEEGAAPHWEQSSPTSNVLVCRPRTSITAGGFADEQMPALQTLLEQLVADEGIDESIVWMYTPMALPLARRLRSCALVYDCMDELSAFRFAPVQLVEREAELMLEADLVFTGGHSLYRAKQGRHPNVHCFPSSVDAGHFRRGLSLPEPTDQSAIPHPRLGYCGVIDERMDLDLLAALADAHPEWQIVMIGPEAKIAPEALPQRPNIHYMGPRKYEQLPAYLAGWDVCLMPFARNEATRFISPTKTLEYMAVERPIVSTPITDVIEPYSGIVLFGDTHEEFIAACEQALDETGTARAQRTARMREALARTSWDRTAGAMERLVERAVEESLVGKAGVA